MLAEGFGDYFSEPSNYFDLSGFVIILGVGIDKLCHPNDTNHHTNFLSMGMLSANLRMMLHMSLFFKNLRSLIHIIKQSVYDL